MAPQTYERKLMAILSADVVDYSRLMGDNEELTIETLTGHRKMEGSNLRLALVYVKHLVKLCEKGRQTFKYKIS